MSKLIIIGGKQKDRISEEWHQYQKGIIIQIDLEHQQLLNSLEYSSPSQVCPDQDPSIVFKAGTVKDRQLYVCTQTEVLIYSLPNLNLTGYLSLPCFNDVHHIRPNQDGNYLVVNTGLDMVVEVDPIKTTILREWNVLGQPPWKRFSKTIDYRKVLTTKPHQSHPNYVFQIGNNIWVTRCLQMDAVCLTKPNQFINIGGAYVHDGIVVGDSIYFTKVDGHVVIVDANSLKVKKEYNLNLFSNAKQSLGCRGIKVLDENTVIVGFSRIRPSKNSSVDAPQFNYYNNVLPTRICCYNLTDGKLIWEHPLEQYGVNAVFSLHTEDE